MPAPSLAASFRANLPCCGRSWTASGSRSSPAGMTAAAPRRKSLPRWTRSPTTCSSSRTWAASHVVYADTSLGRHGAIWGPISQRPVLAADEWPAYGRKLTELAERMADFGVRMAFHHHMGTIVETDEEVGLLMRHTGPAVGLLYDTGHSVFRRRRSAFAGQARTSGASFTCTARMPAGPSSTRRGART